MTCVHLQKPYHLCQEHELKLGGSDLIRVFCHQCGEREVCPSTLMDEYDAKKSKPVIDTKKQQAKDPSHDESTTDLNRAAGWDSSAH